jgi:hypothetical protein
LAEFFEQVPVILMVCLQILAGGKAQTFFFLAGPIFGHFFAGAGPEVGCGTSDIVDVSLEIR